MLVLCSSVNENRFTKWPQDTQLPGVIGKPSSLCKPDSDFFFSWKWWAYFVCLKWCIQQIATKCILKQNNLFLSKFWRLTSAIRFLAGPHTFPEVLLGDNLLGSFWVSMASRGSAWCSWAYTRLTSVFVSFIMNSFPLNLEFANFNNLLMHTSQL